MNLTQPVRYPINICFCNDLFIYFEKVEKGPLTLQTDKEDQSKDCFCYPKPPVLKWPNRDINVVKWANIPKFSTLDDIVTLLRLLKLFFDDVLVDKSFGYTKL